MKGSPARTIREASVTEDVNLIVVGTSQRAGLDRVLLGSVAQDVLKEAARDILIIPFKGD